MADRMHLDKKALEERREGHREGPSDKGKNAQVEHSGYYKQYERGGGKVTERPGDQSGLEQKDLDIIGNFLAKKQTLDLEYIINCKKGMDNEKALAIWKEKLGEMHQESHDKFKSTGSSIKPLSELKRKPED